MAKLKLFNVINLVHCFSKNIFSFFNNQPAIKRSITKSIINSLNAKVVII